MNILLKARVGSHAYGLAREGSDEDFLGVYAADTVDVLGLDGYKHVEQSIVTKDPDTSMHEVGKFARLALACNPTILELLWVDQDEVVDATVSGLTLREIRSAFLSAKPVADAYRGYAKQQIERMKRREADGSAVSDDSAKKKKHARHCLRLLEQGRGLYTTGRLEVRLADPARFFALDDMPFERVLIEYAQADLAFDVAISAGRCALPDKPDRELVNEVVLSTRRRYL